MRVSDIQRTENVVTNPHDAISKPRHNRGILESARSDRRVKWTRRESFDAHVVPCEEHTLLMRLDNMHAESAGWVLISLSLLGTSLFSGTYCTFQVHSFPHWLHVLPVIRMQSVSFTALYLSLRNGIVSFSNCSSLFFDMQCVLYKCSFVILLGRK